MQTIKLHQFLDSKYAISLKEAERIGGEIEIGDDQEILIDFLDIDVVSSPFLRTLFGYFKGRDIKYENAKDLIVDKWEQIINEEENKFDVYKTIDELGITK